jgi:hypothetical protein
MGLKRSKKETKNYDAMQRRVETHIIPEKSSERCVFKGRKVRHEPGTAHKKILEPGGETELTNV